MTTLAIQTSALGPIYLELVPLSLEEPFLYELGGADDDLNDLLA